MKKILLVVFILTFSFSFINAQNFVAGYYPNWLTGTLPPNKIKFENLTHIIHSFAWPTSTGSLEMYSGMPSASLVNAAHNAGVKVLLAFGGWGQSAGFAPLAADSAARANFINNVVQLFSQYNLDGIDLDWEYPSNTTEGRNLTTLVKELREKFDAENPEWLITMAVSAGSWTGQYLEYPKLAEYVDWFGVMAYDFHGTWTSHAGHNAPLYQPSNCYDGASDVGVKYLTVTRQVPKQKVVMGIPFYGREFKSKGLYQTQSSGTADLGYSSIVNRLNNDGWEYFWDDFSKVPYLLDTARTKFVSFEDTTSIRIKCEYALDNQLKGVMIWALGHDVISNSQPLLETVGETMGLITTVGVLPDHAASDFYLFDNYPNPFNPATKIRFSIPETSLVNLKVYDVLGREVVTLVDELKFKGSYEVTFYASTLSSGLYTYVLTSGNFVQSKKMLLIK